MLDTSARKHVQNSFDFTARKSGLIKLHPNAITTTALVFGVCACVALALKAPVAALGLLWLSGLLDVLDGTVARLTGKTSKLGGYLDLVFDRIVESCIIFAFYFYMPKFAVLYFIFLVGMIFNFTTFMLAGTLFKNNGKKSMHYDGGLVERTECFIVFSLMMIFPEYLFIPLSIFNLLMILTGIIRLAKVIKHESRRE